MHHFTYAKRKSYKCCPWYTDQTYSFARKLSGIPKTWKTELVTEQVLVIGFCTYPVFFFILIAAFRLLIKTAILMPEAKEGEVTIVEVESVGHNKTKVLRCWCCQTINSTEQCIRDARHFHFYPMHCVLLLYNYRWRFPWSPWKAGAICRSTWMSSSHPRLLP